MKKEQRAGTESFVILSATKNLEDSSNALRFSSNIPLILDPSVVWDNKATLLNCGTLICK